MIACAAVMWCTTSLGALAQGALGAQAVVIKTDGTIVTSGYGFEPPASYSDGPL